MTTAILSSRGQIVIPAKLRRAAQLDVGDVMAVGYNASTKELTLKKAETLDEMADRFTAWITPGTEPLDDVTTLRNARKVRM
ncbi:MAG: AbrB/MazE/SpoVT family DNA-binding domain-containing protein [Actinomycetes bacterium]|jgi:bifunctional DNA-binding transcriptional regulator/antitoxin component of YhaV-PrlF toxin-antitoxin module|nr:AbrB/MazE/SpoVT family DNA-binding domain-containing protein [Actinomycetes bacterium]